jgi:hypothetical protein
MEPKYGTEKGLHDLSAVNCQRVLKCDGLFVIEQSN